MRWRLWRRHLSSRPPPVDSSSSEPSRGELSMAAPAESPADTSSRVWSCIQCEALSLDNWPKRTYVNVQEGAQSGCNRCWIIAQAVQAVVDKREIFQNEDWGEGLGILVSRGDWSIIFCFRESVHFYVKIFVEQPTGIADELKCLPTRFIITEEGVPDACLKFASDALQNCIENHPRCSGKSSSDYIPKRLVDVDTDGVDTDGKVKIVNDARSSVSKATKYAALTYCWGPRSDEKVEMLTMTAQDLLRKAGGIPVKKLPQVFQDAVKTTRSLKIRYLWIDALCIAQGDEEEWKTESLTMQEVYAGAYFTISADAASDCNQPFLEMPNRRWREAVEICKGTNEFGSKIFARLGDDFRNLPRYELPESKLHSRGWTLQELLLSTRLISFTFVQVYFSCAGGKQSSEDGDDSDDRSYRRDLAWQVASLRRKWWQLGSAPQNIPDEEFSELWHDLVTQYTHRDLTEPNDMLPAISGLASHLRQQSSSHKSYCAGLWRETFVRDLCWSRKATRARTTPTKSPSWSWVSCPFSVKYFFPYGNSLAQIEALNHSAEDEEFGHIDSAEAMIKGPMFEVDLDIDVYGRRMLQGCPRGLSHLEYSLHFYMDRPTGRDENGISGSSSLLSMRGYPPDLWTRCGKVLLLALLGNELHVNHLVLVRTTTRSDRYLRVGLCVFSADSRNRRDREEAAKSWMANFKPGCITMI